MHFLKAKGSLWGIKWVRRPQKEERERGSGAEEGKGVTVCEFWFSWHAITLSQPFPKCKYSEKLRWEMESSCDKTPPGFHVIRLSWAPIESLSLGSFLLKRCSQATSSVERHLAACHTWESWAHPRPTESECSF